jgi:ornithine carbamoyltransferase
MLTILERFGQLKGLKMTFIGDGNNVAVSLAFACMRLGIDYTVAAPEGFALPSRALAMAEEMSQESGASLRQTHDPRAAVEGAHIIYTDTWVSMGQEDESQRRREIFPPFQVNGALVDLADPSVIVMHCLPAHRGDEITDQVADGPHSVIFQQAENRLHAQKAILATLMS